MRIKILIAVLLGVGLLGGFAFGRYTAQISYNPDTHVPDWVETAARNIPYFKEKYPRVKIADIPHTEGKAEVLGQVMLVQQEPDGDIHVVLADGGSRVVGEIIPELKMDPPKQGDYILASGLIWYDNGHQWWELHPIVSWQKVNQ